MAVVLVYDADCPVCRAAADWVRATVDELGPRLSPLSRREALKHLT